MRTGIPAIPLAPPIAAVLGNRGVPGYGEEWNGGRHVGAIPASRVRAAALPRPGVSSSTPAGRMLHRRTVEPRSRRVAAHPTR
jgi:hypothetical protein